MGLANDMQKLADDILASYKTRADELQQRLKGNDMMVKEVQEMLQGFRNDHQEIVDSIKANAKTLKENAKKLRSDMAEEDQERLKSFKTMMDGINGTISRIQDEVVSIRVSTENMLKDFSNAHQEMTSKMQQEFTDDKNQRAEWNENRMESFNNMMQNIHTDMARINNEVAGIFKDVAKFLADADNMMKDFAGEHKEMSAELRANLQASLNDRRKYTKDLLEGFSKRLAEISKENNTMAQNLRNDLDQFRSGLAKSDMQRLKDFKVTMGAIQGKVNEIQTFVNTMLGDLKNNRIQASEIWQKLSEAKAKIDQEAAPAQPAKKAKAKEKAAPAPPKKEVVAKEKPVVAPPKKEDAIKEKPAQANEKVEPPETEVSLDEKVLDYIAKNPNGVKVSDMEGPLGETRMRIGFIAKQLLDEGKLNKVDNLYFPKTEK
ncbi:MAG: hypothetical protein K9H15_03140 [Bacteroidales bacterium]|nr:hypothetical protein [Bacteroidales bacterium]